MKFFIKKVASLVIVVGMLMMLTGFSYVDTNNKKQTMNIGTDSVVKETEYSNESIESFALNENDVTTKIDRNTKIESVYEKSTDENLLMEKENNDNIENFALNEYDVTSTEKEFVYEITADVNQLMNNENDDSKESSENKTATDIVKEIDQTTQEDQKNEMSNLIIAQVNDYVNIRDKVNIDSEVMGKLYNNSIGALLETEGDWYKIKSGQVIGYVKSEYVLTGSEAEAMAKKVGQRMAKVTTMTLKVRQEPNLDAIVLGLVPEGDILVVSEELDGWIKVSVEEGDGYVSSDYVEVYTKNVFAESKLEEEERLKKEEEDRSQAIEAAKINSIEKSEKEVKVSNGLGERIAEYAMQFVGNPYVYGGTSLTKGADCSGYVMRVYEKFGISLPRTSAEQGQKGSKVSGIDKAKAGDLVWYSGHIGIYIGDGKLVHASNSKPYPQGGIKISNINYRPILSIRRIV
jgi:SH3-like domain-containing protein